MEVRLDVKVISAAALAQYMEHKGWTVRTLAVAVERELLKKNKGARFGFRSLGHLRSGKRDNCPPEVGAAIERVLGAPPGSLFSDRLSPVQREKGRAA